MREMNFKIERNSIWIFVGQRAHRSISRHEMFVLQKINRQKLSRRCRKVQGGCERYFRDVSEKVNEDEKIYITKTDKRMMGKYFLENLKIIFNLIFGVRNFPNKKRENFHSKIFFVPGRHSEGDYIIFKCTVQAAKNLFTLSTYVELMEWNP